MPKREPNHCVKGRPYAGTLEERVSKAKKMIADMCSKGRCPHMSIPANGLVHAEPCGDEDIYIRDLLTRIFHKPCSIKCNILI